MRQRPTLSRAFLTIQRGQHVSKHLFEGGLLRIERRFDPLFHTELRASEGKYDLGTVEKLADWRDRKR
jgi:hypothetical protein